MIDAELHNRGGYLDKLADDYWFKADSKRMRALRAFALQASLARIASVAPKNDQDRTLMAIRIGNATDRAQLVIQCGFTKNPVTGNPVDGDPCFYFDSLMVDYTTALFDLAMIAFPVEETKNLLGVVVGGFSGPTGALEALNGILGLAKEALKYGRVIGAIYRDTVELEVQVWISSADAPQTNIPPKFQVTPAAVADLKAAYGRGNDDMPLWVSQMNALRAAGLEPVPDPRFIDELSAVMTYLCSLIVNTKNSAYQNCKGSQPMAKISTAPTSPPAPTPSPGQKPVPVAGAKKAGLSGPPTRSLVLHSLPQQAPSAPQAVLQNTPASAESFVEASAN